MPKQKTCAQCGKPRAAKQCKACGHIEARGGSRAAAGAAGRPRNEPDELDIKLSKGWASGVLNRIGELGLRYRDDDDDDPELESDNPTLKAAAIARVKKRIDSAPVIRNAEDYALDILRRRDAAARDLFKLCLAYRLGKPVQPVIQADTREDAPELEWDGLRMPSGGRNAQDKPAAAGQPN